MKPAKHNSLAKEDVPRFLLLVMLYFIQGIPVGLTFGTVPFLLKSMAKNTSFTQLGVFTMATYPYSLKIFWSPIVDSIYWPKVGRRRSWIIPIQLISGILLFLFGYFIQYDHIFPGVDAYFNPSNYDTYGTFNEENFKKSITSISVPTLAFYFCSLIFLCATQDIAVDGWALTILSQKSISYASTAQTVGLNTGYFLSFTVFIALNSNDFANKYLRSTPLPYGLISLSGYMKFSGLLYIITTIYMVFFTTENVKNLNQGYDSHLPKSNLDEKPTNEIFNEDDTHWNRIKDVYKNFGLILKLKHVQILSCIHLFSKLAFQCNEGATNLKLLEKGFKREDLAITVLIDFPFEIIFGYYVAKWSSTNITAPVKDNHRVTENSVTRKSSSLQRFIYFCVGEQGPLTPWLWGFIGRLSAAFLGNFVLHHFPKSGEVSSSYFLLVIFQHLLSSFMSTVQFVSISSFHSRIADPKLGGTYMTLLNTLSNLGGTWPRIIVMSLISKLTIYSVSTSGLTEGENRVILRDGYYITNCICICIGFAFYTLVLRRTMNKLQALPLAAWRS